MGVYNSIELPDVRCPVCGELTTVIAQMHTASSPDGDERGLYCLQTYRVGERMRWFPESSPAFSSWIDEFSAIDVDGKVQECCYSHCQAHHDQLYAVIEYVDVTPIRLVSFGPEGEWPSGFPR